MTSYQETMKKLGVKEADLSAKLKKRVRDFNEALKEVEEANASIESGELEEDELEEMKEAYNESLEELEQMDNDLSKAISESIRKQKYAKKKEEPIAEAVVEQAPVVEAAPEVVTEQPKEEAKEEKKGGFPFLLGVVLVALTGGVAYKFLKK